MKEAYVGQALQDLASQEVPDGLDLWPALRKQLRPVPRMRPALVLRWAGLVVALVVLLGTVAYAAAMLVQRFHPASQLPAAQAGWGEPLYLIQAMDGVTVSLQHAYADAGSVAIALAISSTGAQRYVPDQITLTNAAGTVLSQTVGYCLAGRPDQPCAPPGPRNGLFLLAFALPAWSNITSTVWAGDLHLVVRLRQLEALTLTLRGSDSHNSPTDAAPPTLVGPFRFDFRLLPPCRHGSQSLVPPLQSNAPGTVAPLTAAVLPWRGDVCVAFTWAAAQA